MKKTIDATLGLYTLEIEITTRCNFSCRHCYNRQGFIGDLSFYKVKYLIDFAFENNLINLVITGGEPLIHPEFNEIATLIFKKKINTKGKKPRVVLQTNGFLLKKTKLNSLKAFDVLHLSIDTVEELRSNISHLNKAIAFLKKHNLSFYLFFTIHKKNLIDLGKVIDFGLRNNIKIAFNFLLPTTSKLKKLTLSQKELFETAKELRTLYKKGKILRPSCPLFSVFDKKKKAFSYIGNLGGCVAGIAACIVGANDDVMPCPFLRIVAGNIGRDSLKKIGWSQRFLKI